MEKKNGELTVVTPRDLQLLKQDPDLFWKGVNRIGTNAFVGCNSLREIVIPSGVVSIGDRAFCGLDELANVSMPASVTIIGDGAFEWCSNLKDINLPMQLNSIGDSAFCGCIKLISLKLPRNIKNIGWNAFTSCGITSIYIPDCLDALKVGALSCCQELKSISIYDKSGNINSISYEKVCRQKHLNMPPEKLWNIIRQSPEMLLTQNKVLRNGEDLTLAVVNNLKYLYSSNSRSKHELGK